jgi:DNA-binding NarL/FixJ family response regulator
MTSERHRTCLCFGMQHIRLLDVGQCGVDGPRMTQLFQRELDAVVERADDLTETREKLADAAFDLILVNRVLAADGSSGLDVIDALINDGCEAPVMLVSDRDDAQEEAIAHGAIRGFGKSKLWDPDTVELICKAAQGARG